MLPREAELVSEWTGEVCQGEWSVKRFHCSDRLDTALYKIVPLPVYSLQATTGKKSLADVNSVVKKANSKLEELNGELQEINTYLLSSSAASTTGGSTSSSGANNNSVASKSGFVVVLDSSVVVLDFLWSFWTVVLWPFWIVVLWSFWTVILWSFWTVILWSFWTVILWSFWTVILSSFWTVDMFSYSLMVFVCELLVYFEMCYDSIWLWQMIFFHSSSEQSAHRTCVSQVTRENKFSCPGSSQ